MLRTRMLLAAALLAIPAVAFAAPVARAESPHDLDHGRRIEFSHSGSHYANPRRGREAYRAHGQDHQHATRRNHRPWLGFVPERRHHNSH